MDDKAEKRKRKTPAKHKDMVRSDQIGITSESESVLTTVEQHSDSRRPLLVPQTLLRTATSNMQQQYGTILNFLILPSINYPIVPFFL